jgi:nitroreductase
MMMQNVMVLARGYGLETCPQAAWVYYGPVVHKELGIPDDEIMLSGRALGFADWSVREIELTTERVRATEFAVVHEA